MSLQSPSPFDPQVRSDARAHDVSCARTLPLWIRRHMDTPLALPQQDAQQAALNADPEAITCFDLDHCVADEDDDLDLWDDDMMASLNGPSPFSARENSIPRLMRRNEQDSVQ